MANLNVDLTGREVKPGDLISYPTLLGRSAGISIFRVLEVTPHSEDSYSFGWSFRKGDVPYKLRVKMLMTNGYGVNLKPSTLQYPERAVILGPEFEAIVGKL
jgi:hypothetical protein